MVQVLMSRPVGVGQTVSYDTVHGMAPRGTGGNKPTLVCRRVLGVERAHPLDEALHAALLKEAHQGRLEGLAGVRGHLGDGGFGGAALLDVAAGDLLELEVAGDVGRDEDVGQLARRHEELGHQVDVPVVEAAVLGPGLGALGVVAIALEELPEEVLLGHAGK
jgi:hypothetical protein